MPVRPEVLLVETVLITGGTGHLGRDVVAELKPRYRVRVLARSPGPDPDVEWVKGDLATGAGVPEAVAGARIVVHAATLSPAARRGYLLPADFWRSPPQVDVDGTRRLLDEARRAGVAHVAHISIVGVGRSSIPYMRVKRTAEELVRGSGVPWSVLRATQFHWLADRMLGKAARLPLPAVPGSLVAQPVDSRDFAAYVADRVREGPGGDCAEFGGPEVLELRDLAGQWQRARGRALRVLNVPVPARVRQAARDMTAPHGRLGRTTWSQWLNTHGPE
ncbi:SDR family oxidoreductase [Streptomyces agglomeratus]|uniref:SDR family oxidoreductase n=1 Tax=Streptomyces agglomeratus TaxID=285458 RepID=UPI000A629227|nr:NAD(P)H-binding protein [Streptomyces agglomeratus]